MEDLFGKRPGVVGSSTGGDGQGGSDGVPTSRARVFDSDISKLTNLGKALQVAERALVQNTYHTKVCQMLSTILSTYLFIHKK